MTRWLTEREQAAWTGLLRLTSGLQAEMNRQLADDHGISLTDYEVLARLQAHGGHGLRIRDLMQTLSWEQSRLSHHLSRMQRRGLVTRQECPEDRRGAAFVLTDLGRGTLEAAAPSHVAHVRRMLFDHLSEEQVDQLRRIAAQGLSGIAETR
jgi:DNA-binding MarR family transcriptional regulator